MVKAEPCNVRKKPNRKLCYKLRILKTGDLLFSLVSEFPVRIAAKQLLSDRGKNLLGDHLQPGLQGVVHLNLPLLSKNLQPPSSISRNPVLRVKLHLTVLIHLCLVLGSSGWDDGLHQPLVHLPAPDEEGWLQQLAHLFQEGDEGHEAIIILWFTKLLHETLSFLLGELLTEVGKETEELVSHDRKR